MSAGFSFADFSSCYICLFVVVSLCHSCSSSHNFSDVLCLADERQALLQLKNGLIDEADRLASWVGEENDCCKWVGIVCNNVTGHVHRIHLRALSGLCRVQDYTNLKEFDETRWKRLRGVISPSLLYLKQLKHLDLSCNDFNGTQVPRFISSLKNLRYLNLSLSRFGGSIPPQLGNLTQIQVLCLESATGETSVTNMEWLSSLRLLNYHLDMRGKNLSLATDWLQVINTLPSLVKLYLSGTQLPDIHSHFASLNLTSLSLLDLFDNYFGKSFVPQWIFSLTSLVELDIRGCGFHYPIARSIDSFGNLTSLESMTEVEGGLEGAWPPPTAQHL